MSNRYPLVQPILVGHHSERRHRRDIERAHDAADAAREADRAAEKAKAKADAARHTTDHRYDPAPSPAESTPSRRPPQSTSQPRRTHPHHRDHGGRSPVHRDHRGRDRRLRRPAARQHRTPDNPDSVLEDVRDAQTARGFASTPRADVTPGDLVKCLRPVAQGQARQPEERQRRDRLQL
ncbi:DUF3560 domain-containing protein, partial [Rhodococcus hoagii]|nr:DUF3560 domain-containing protein [Prescottella equi]